MRTLQSNERITPTTQRRHRHALRLDRLVVAPSVIPQRWIILRHNPVEHVTTVKHPASLRIQNRERPPAVRQDPVNVPVPVKVTTQARHIRNRQPSQLIVPLQSSPGTRRSRTTRRPFRREHRVIQIISRRIHRRRLHRRHEVVPVIPFVRRHIISRPSRLIGRNRIRHEHPERRQARLQLDRLTIPASVTIRKISRHPRIVLQAQWLHRSDRRRRNVQRRNRICFLQSNHRPHPIRRHRDVLRLQIPRSRTPREHPHTSRPQRTLLPVKCPKPSRHHRWRCKPATHINDAHRPNRIRIRRSRRRSHHRRSHLTFVRHKDFRPVRREDQLVRHRTHSHRTQQHPRRRRKERHRPRQCLVRTRNQRRSQHPILHHHMRHVLRRQAQRRRINRSQPHRRSRIRQIDHLNPRIRRTERTLRRRIKGRNLRPAHSRRRPVVTHHHRSCQHRRQRIVRNRRHHRSRRHRHRETHLLSPNRICQHIRPLSRQRRIKNPALNPSTLKHPAHRPRTRHLSQRQRRGVRAHTQAGRRRRIHRHIHRQFMHRQRLRGFTRHQQQRLPTRTVPRSHKRHRFRIQIPSPTQPARKTHRRRIRHVKHQHHVRPLQRHKSIRLRPDRRHRHTFRLRALVVAPPIIEIRKELRRHDVLQHVATVENDVARRVQNRKRTPAVTQNLINVPIPVRIPADPRHIRYRQPPEARLILQGRLVRKHRVVQIIRRIRNRRRLHWHNEIIPVIPFIRRDIIGRSTRTVRRHRIRHVQPVNRLPGPRIHQRHRTGTVPITEIILARREILLP